MGRNQVGRHQYTQITICRHLEVGSARFVQLMKISTSLGAKQIIQVNASEDKDL